MKLALIGTERSSLSPAVKEGLLRIGIDTDADLAKVLLDSASLYHQLRVAGFPLSTYEGGEIEVPSQGSTPLRPASSRSARHLQLILEGRFQGALAEFLKLLEQYQKQLPPEHLPSLFQRSLKSPALWQLLQPLLGPKEYWLLRQNPEWAPLADNPKLESWPQATPEERQAMLRYLRRTQPEEATSVLESSWKTAGYSEKKALLRVMESGLNAEDEAFLESCLDDSRKEVRQQAAILLTRLPESQLQGRLFATAQNWFEVDVSGQLAFQLPEALSEQLKRDGIGQSKKSKYPGGKHANWAFETISRIPPRRWEKHLGRPARDILHLLAKAKHQQLLADAIANAALLHQDHQWLEAFIRFWWQRSHEEAYTSSLGKLVIESLPGPVFNDIVQQYLKQQSSFIEEKSLLSQMLCRGVQHWSDTVGQLVLKGFQEWLSGARSQYWNLWHYKRILKVAAYRVPPRLFVQFRDGWDTRSPIWYHWERDVGRFLRILNFRREMKEELVK